MTYPVEILWSEAETRLRMHHTAKHQCQADSEAVQYHICCADGQSEAERHLTAVTLTFCPSLQS